MLLETSFDEFIDYMKSEKNASKYTLKSYIGYFQIFIHFLSNQCIEPRIDTITTPVLRRYIAYLKNDKNYKVETIRRSELTSLNWQDIDFKNNIIVVKHAKGNKQRVIPIIEHLISDLWAYLQTRLPLKNNAVFISELENRLSFTPLNQLFHKYLKLAGLEEKGYTLHKFRHSYATLLLQDGADLISIKELMGHSDLNSTKFYNHMYW